MKVPVTVLALSALAFASPAPTAAASPSATASACNSIKLGGERFVFYRNGMRCRKAKRLARSVYRNHEPPGPRWKCWSGSGFKRGGGCARRDGGRNFGWHPAD